MSYTNEEREALRPLQIAKRDWEVMCGEHPAILDERAIDREVASIHVRAAHLLCEHFPEQALRSGGVSWRAFELASALVASIPLAGELSSVQAEARLQCLEIARCPDEESENELARPDWLRKLSASI